MKKQARLLLSGFLSIVFFHLWLRHIHRKTAHALTEKEEEAVKKRKRQRVNVEGQSWLRGSWRASVVADYKMGDCETFSFIEFYIMSHTNIS